MKTLTIRDFYGDILGSFVCQNDYQVSSLLQAYLDKHKLYAEVNREESFKNDQDLMNQLDRLLPEED